MFPEKVYYEPDALSYKLGQALKKKYSEVPWVPVESHNRIDELRTQPNSAFRDLKRLLIVGVRKTHRYVPNAKTSDFLVPYTSSGCSAMCLYCYLVCNYNKCSYLRLFVNREEMLEKLKRTALRAERDLTFEIGSNSDLVLENTITHNLEWTIERFAEQEKGFITFPTKFSMVEPLLPLKHHGRAIFRMSVNPQEVIRTIELGTSPLKQRIHALNQMADAGYRTGLLIAPVILLDDWKKQYLELLETLSSELSERAKRGIGIEVIFMTYSYVHRAINTEGFPKGPDLFDSGRMTGRGKGKYCYRPEVRAEAEEFLRLEIEKRFGPSSILYIV
ncbi:SPL family radical SAM protein [Caproicibacter sp. BJN0012]|uniref:SPL family radical SAM protein n=1 Tax=Caproicibacter sp. BJN0012 TaxID=3110227 RepID=UPI002E0E5F37